MMFGARAAEAVAEGRFGTMVSARGIAPACEFSLVDLSNAEGKINFVDVERYYDTRTLSSQGHRHVRICSRRVNAEQLSLLLHLRIERIRPAAQPAMNARHEVRNRRIVARLRNDLRIGRNHRSNHLLL